MFQNFVSRLWYTRIDRINKTYDIHKLYTKAYDKKWKILRIISNIYLDEGKCHRMMIIHHKIEHTMFHFSKSTSEHVRDTVAES